MNKPKFCLAMSVSLTLMQANLLQAQAEPNANAIWQTMATAGASSKTANLNAKSVATKPSKAATKTTAKTTAKTTKVNVPDAHSMLFLGDKSKQGAADSAAPAAALTIHPAMNAQQAPVAMTQDTEATPSGLLAMGEGSVPAVTTSTVNAEAARRDNSKQCLLNWHQTKWWLKVQTPLT